MNVNYFSEIASVKFNSLSYFISLVIKMIREQVECLLNAILGHVKIQVV